MTTGKITLDTGSTLHTTTYTVSEDAVTKHIPRSVLNDSAGAEKGVAANPLYVIPSGGTVSVSNTVSVTGSTTIISMPTVTITGSTSVINIVTITGSTAVISMPVVTITGSTSVISMPTVTITGSTSVINTVTVTGSTTLVGISTITGSTSVINTVSITGSTTALFPIDLGRIFSTTTGTLSATNGTLVISSSSLKIKVYAFSVTTTSSTQQIVKFQSAIGSGDLWTVGLLAASTSSTGANLAVSPPGYLFAAPTASILNLNLSNPNAVHWAISYFLEA